jgi:hypothetical protein
MVSDASVTELVRIVERDKRLPEHEDVTAVIQLLDNSVFQVGGPGGTHHLPSDDSCGTCHIDGALYVADKPAVRDLVNKLTLKTLGPTTKKVFLSPLTKYWLKPCCTAPGHLTNYTSPHYLPSPGSMCTHCTSLHVTLVPETG